MNRKQWFALAWSCMLIGMMFIGIDNMNNHCLNARIDYVPYGELDISDVWCVVNAEIYEPFIYLSYALFVVFYILGFMENKK